MAIPFKIFKDLAEEEGEPSMKTKMVPTAGIWLMPLGAVGVGFVLVK
jgi:hypothetical protein